MKKKIMLLIIILILIFSTAIIIIMTSCGNTNKNKIIKNFKNNKELFEKVIIELTEESEDIYFEKKGNVILISIHEHVGDEVNIIRIKQEEFYKYNKTIELIRLLDIKQINKINDNIEFLFTDTFLNGGKYITYIKDMEDYINNGHKIIEKKSILENWYYILNDAL